MARSNLVRIGIDHDALSASAMVFVDGDGNSPSIDDIRNALLEAGVTFGIDPEAVALAAGSKPGIKTIVASGVPPKPGCDALITLKENPAKKRAPKLLPDGRVDYRDLQLVHNVVRGQVLATKEPAMAGLPGMNVKSQPIPALLVADPALPQGKNTAVTGDGVKLLSLIDGALFISGTGKKIEMRVEETFVLSSSVDISTGNIFCIGSCIIKGRVNEGFRVEANGDILIKSDAEGSEYISHKGSITFECGVRGHMKGKIVAARNVKARFIENATVQADGDIVVSEYVYHSKLLAGGSIIAEGNPGIIMGGSVSFMKKLACRQIGSEANPKTRIYFGDWRSGEARTRIAEIAEILAELKIQADGMRDALLEMRRLTMDDPDANKSRITELARCSESFPNIMERIALLEEEEKTLAKQIKTLDVKPSIEVSGTLYSGAILAGEGISDVPVKKDRKAVEIKMTIAENSRPGFTLKPLRG